VGEPDRPADPRGGGEGKFDDLPHQGVRLPLDDDSAAGDRALAFRMLRNAGYAPGWIEADKEVRELLARRDAILARAPRSSPLGRRRDRDELQRIVTDHARAVARLNAEAPTERQHRQRLDLATELERLDRVHRGV
jgi:hypothetical protein